MKRVEESYGQLMRTDSVAVIKCEVAIVASDSEDRRPSVLLSPNVEMTSSNFPMLVPTTMNMIESKENRIFLPTTEAFTSVVSDGF